MGLSFSLIGFPVFVLAISALLTGAGGLTGNASVSLGTTSFGSGTAFSTTPCTPDAFTANRYNCFTPAAFNSQAPLVALFFPTTSFGCSSPCNTAIQSQSGTGTVVLASCVKNADISFTCNSTQGFSTTQQTATPFALNFGGITLSTGFFVAFIGIALTAVALIGIQVLGTGIGTESVHILFVGGVALGIWLAFSSAEGFLVGSPTSFFSQLDAANRSLSIGTIFYVVLSLMYLIGTVGLVSRGNS